MSFIFILVCFLHVNLGLSQKMWAKSGEFLFLGRGYLGSRETFCPPPPNFKVVPAPLRDRDRIRDRDRDKDEDWDWDWDWDDDGDGSIYFTFKINCH